MTRSVTPNLLFRSYRPRLRSLGRLLFGVARLHAVAVRATLAVLPWSAIFVAMAVVGACRPRQTNKRKDSCRVMVQRQLACLKLDKAGSGFFGRERVEEALMDRKQAIRLCHEALAATPSLARRLTRCLRFRDCERLGACYEDLFVMTRVYRVLGNAGRDALTSPRVLDRLSALCGDHYVTGRLARMADPDARALSKRLGSVCREVAQTKVDRVSRHLDRLVRDRLGHKVVSRVGGGLTLRGICGDVQHKPTEKHLPGADSATPSDHGTSPVVEPAQSAALRAICREPWRLRSLLNRSRKLGDILDRASQSPAGLERAFKVCRAAGAIAGPLRHVGLPSVELAAFTLLRRCRVDLPATWVFVRLGPLDVAEGATDQGTYQGTPRRSHGRVGRWTCLRARTILARMKRGHAVDPLTHLATALVQARCARWRRARPGRSRRTRQRPAVGRR